ncbi:Thaumatin-like protein 1 [Glycine max]|nr:Thaumatin-like protein 1 [Glycine max]
MVEDHVAVIGVEAGENLNHPTLKLIGGEGLVGLSGIDNDGGQVGSEELEDKEYSCKLGLILYVVAQGAKVTFTNKYIYMLWPVTQTGDQKPQLSTTGFELSWLQEHQTLYVDLPSPWSSAFRARTECSNNNGRFNCATVDCTSDQVACNGAGSILPATKAEITVAENRGQDFYDVSNVDDFNIPMSLTAQGGSGDYKTLGCLRNINHVCPSQLQQPGPSGNVIACKSACVAFNADRYCHLGDYLGDRYCFGVLFMPAPFRLVFNIKPFKDKEKISLIKRNTRSTGYPPHSDEGALAPDHN